MFCPPEMVPLEVGHLQHPPPPRLGWRLLGHLPHWCLPGMRPCRVVRLGLQVRLGLGLLAHQVHSVPRDLPIPARRVRGAHPLDLRDHQVLPLRRPPRGLSELIQWTTRTDP